MSLATDDMPYHSEKLHAYVRYVEKSGLKQRIMYLLQHEESSVKYEALVAVQKMMVHNW